MNYRYSKLAGIDALLSLIPIFPTWTLFIGIGLGEGLKSYTSCEGAYATTELILFLAALCLTIAFIMQIEKRETSWTDNQVKKRYRLFNLAVYTLLNNVLLIFILTPYQACFGQSDSILAAIYSGPLTSIFLVLIGFIIDLKRKITAHNISL